MIGQSLGGSSGDLLGGDDQGRPLWVFLYIILYNGAFEVRLPFTSIPVYARAVFFAQARRGEGGMVCSWETPMQLPCFRSRLLRR